MFVYFIGAGMHFWLVVDTIFATRGFVRALGCVPPTQSPEFWLSSISPLLWGDVGISSTASGAEVSLFSKSAIFVGPHIQDLYMTLSAQLRI